MKRADVERRVRQIPWPEPTEGLRARVLSAAPVVDRRITWSDRVWFSRVWRIAAVAAAVGAIAVASFSEMPDVTHIVPSPEIRAEVQAIDDTSREIGLPPELSASLARRMLVSAGRASGKAEQRGLPVEGLISDGDIR